VFQIKLDHYAHKVKLLKLKGFLRFFLSKIVLIKVDKLKLNFIYFSETKNYILSLFKLDNVVSIILTNLVGKKTKKTLIIYSYFNIIQACHV